MNVYVVTDSKDDEPCVFKNSKTAYDFIVDIMTNEMNRYGCDTNEITKVFSELEESYKENESCFGTYWLDRNMYCYECEIM